MIRYLCKSKYFTVYVLCGSISSSLNFFFIIFILDLIWLIDSMYSTVFLDFLNFNFYPLLLYPNVLLKSLCINKSVRLSFLLINFFLSYSLLFTSNSSLFGIQYPFHINCLKAIFSYRIYS